MSTTTPAESSRLQRVEAKEAAWAELERKVRENAEMAPSKIKLDVGGKIFATTKGNLLRFEGSYFHAMLASGHWQPDSDGAYFLDLNPEGFDRALDYLRSGELSFEGLRPDQARVLRKTLDYLQLPLEDEERVKWDPQRCGPSITLSEENRTATNTLGSWNSVLSTTPSARFSLRILRGNGVMVGFAQLPGFTMFAHTNSSSGWYFNAMTGTLYPQIAFTGRPYGNSTAVPVGGVVTAILDRPTNTISFEVDGQSFGVAFRDIPTQELFAAVSLCAGTAVELVD